MLIYQRVISYNLLMVPQDSLGVRENPGSTIIGIMVLDEALQENPMLFQSSLGMAYFLNPKNGRLHAPNPARI
jgi:hypothetical protein